MLVLCWEYMFLIAKKKYTSFILRKFEEKTSFEKKLKNLKKREQLEFFFEKSFFVFFSYFCKIGSVPRQISKSKDQICVA